MLTVTLDRDIDQDAIANFPKSFSQIALEVACAATHSFLNQCKISWEAKQLPKVDWDNIKQILGWNSHTANGYAKTWQWISDLGIDTYNLELLDINTIKALCCDKYLEIWHQLQSARMVVEDVRAQMAEINKSLRVPKEPPKVLEWEQTKWGEDGDARLIIRLEDPQTGRELEKQFKESGKITVAVFLKELLRRPSLDEQVLAQQELEEYIEEQQLELPADTQAGIARENRITELTAQLRKVNNAIANLIDDGHDEESLPLKSATDAKKAIVRELAMYGIVPIETRQEENRHGL